MLKIERKKKNIQGKKGFIETTPILLKRGTKEKKKTLTLKINNTYINNLALN